MATPRYQPVNIIVNTVWPESWTEEQLCSWLERYLTAKLGKVDLVQIVRKPLDTQELPGSTTPSVEKNTDA